MYHKETIIISANKFTINIESKIQAHEIYQCISTFLNDLGASFSSAPCLNFLILFEVLLLFEVSFFPFLFDFNDFVFPGGPENFPFFLKLSRSGVNVVTSPLSK